MQKGHEVHDEKVEGIKSSEVKRPENRDSGTGGRGGVNGLLPLVCPPHCVSSGSEHVDA